MSVLVNLCLFLFRPLIFLENDKSLSSSEVSRPVGTAGEVGDPIGTDAEETGWPPRAAEKETVCPPRAAEETDSQAMANEDAGGPADGAKEKCWMSGASKETGWPASASDTKEACWPAGAAKESGCLDSAANNTAKETG